MTNVYEANVRFMKRVQVREYEPMEGEVTFKAQFPDGSDHVALSNTLMQEAREVVLGGLRGVAKPAAAVTKTATFKGGEPTITAAANAAANAPAATASDIPGEEAKAEAPKADANDIPGEEAPKRRGRPTKAETEAKKAAAATASDIPGEDPVKLGAPVPTEASDIPVPTEASDIPGEEQEAWEKVSPEDETQEISATDLQNHISFLVDKRKITVPRVKAILAEYGAAQCRNLKPDELIKVKNAIDAVVSGS